MHQRLRSLKWLTFLGLMTLVAGSCAEPNPRPNIVVIVVDALRRDHLGAYGYPRDTSPRFDAFADSSTLFLQATASCPWTIPSVASLFTGLYPSVHGTVEHFGNTANRLDGNVATLAEVLSKAGYRTAGFVANAWLDPRLGFDRGFDLYDQVSPRSKPRAFEVNAKVLAWLNQPPEDPFFLYVHYMDTHGPYGPPDPFDHAFQSKSTRRLSIAERKKLGYLEKDFTLDRNDFYFYLDQYDGEILFTDGHLGQLLDALVENDLLAESIVVITSDHGEAFLEHGHWDHGNTVFTEEIAIPVAIHFPDWVAAGHRESLAAVAASSMELKDLAPTLVELAGTRFPHLVNGRNLLAADPIDLANHPVRSEELAVQFKGAPKISWQQGNLKAIFDPAVGRVTQMYYLADDPGELVDLAQEPGLAGEVASFDKAILNHFQSASRLRADLGITSNTIVLDPALRKKLESLGYTR